MNAHQNASRITDVVPANFLCDNQTMQKIAASQVSDEKALSSLEETLSGLELRRQRLVDELASVGRLISEAVAEQTRLRSSIATHKSLLSHTPVRALPGEVLSEIFLHFIALAQPTRGTVFQEIVACHRNHALILQARTLKEGSDDEEDSDDEERKPVTHPMISGIPQQLSAYWKALESGMKQTSSLPLQLLFHFDDYGRNGNHDDAISSLKTLIRLFPRADTISLHIRSSQDLIPEFASIMGSAHIPHTDAVRTARVDVDNEVFGQKIVSAIPNVEVLETRAVNLIPWFTGTSTAGHCLRSLHLVVHWSEWSMSITLVHVLDLLERAPLLETLKLGRISVTRPLGTLRVVTHTLLSTFHLPSVTAEDNDAVFGHLTLPALRSLSFGVEGQRYYWPRPSNLSFLQRSHCMLTELAICACLVDEERLLTLLRVQSKLVTLQLNFSINGAGGGAPIPMPNIDFLSKGAVDRPLPALKVLGLSVLPRQLKAVKRLIQSRSAKKSGIVALREVDIRVETKQRGDKIKKDEYADLFKEFRDKGTEIRISYR